jgi:iron complex transport system ATP-binding protein
LRRPHRHDDLNLASALADELVLLAKGRVEVIGSPDAVLRDNTLSAAQGCEVRVNKTLDGNRPFVLPPAAFLGNNSPSC